MEKRGGALIDINRDRVKRRIRDYFDSDLPWDEYKARHRGLTDDAARFVAKEARAKAVRAEPFDAERLRRFMLRPFDVRWCYYTPVRPIWNEPRPSLWAQNWPGNQFLLTRPSGVASPEGVPLCFTKALGDNDALRGHAYYIPLMVKNGSRLQKQAEATLFAALGDKPEADEPVANLSRAARTMLESFKFKNPDDPRSATLIWLHALAIGYSAAYLTENADGLRRDWPRIPLPVDRKALEASASLGEKLVSLLDTEAEVPGVTVGKYCPAIKMIGGISRIATGGNAAGATDLAVTAGWGHKGKEGVTMPAKGKLVARAYDANEVKAIEAEAAERGLSVDEVRQLLGEETLDVFLNGTTYWRNIPRNVWEYYIGGYQVIKKWLSYREDAILGRALNPDEAREVTSMARRLAAIVLMQPTLNENYRAVTAATYAWPAE